jgi:hypothetical protein
MGPDADFTGAKFISVCRQEEVFPFFGKPALFRDSGKKTILL